MTKPASPAVAPVFPEFDPDTIERSIAGTWQWLGDHSIEILVASAIGFALYLVLAFLKGRASKYHQKAEDKFTLGAIIAKALSRTGHIFMFILSVRLVSGFANTPATLENIIMIAFTAITVFQVAVWLREIILGLVQRRAALNDDPGSETLANAMTLIRILVTVAIFAIALIMVLDNLGFNVTGLVAGLGVGGIAIGLAAQGIFSDLFAAMSIIFDKPFKRGETIRYDTTTATVEKIGLKSTRLRAITGEEVIISNTNLLAKEIINFTRLVRRRTRFAIGLVYQTVPEKARVVPQLLQEIVEAHDAIFIRCGFVGFGASSLNFELDFDIFDNDYEKIFAGRHAIGLAILDKLNTDGYEFAYPTQTTFTAAPDGTLVMPYAVTASANPL